MREGEEGKRGMRVGVGDEEGIRWRGGGGE